MVCSEYTKRERYPCIIYARIFFFAKFKWAYLMKCGNCNTDSGDEMSIDGISISDYMYAEAVCLIRKIRPVL